MAIQRLLNIKVLEIYEADLEVKSCQSKHHAGLREAHLVNGLRQIADVCRVVILSSSLVPNFDLISPCCNKHRAAGRVSKAVSFILMSLKSLRLVFRKLFAFVKAIGLYHDRFPLIFFLNSLKAWLISQGLQLAQSPSLSKFSP